MICVSKVFQRAVNFFENLCKDLSHLNNENASVRQMNEYTNLNSKLERLSRQTDDNDADAILWNESKTGINLSSLDDLSGK
jgi:hypothetical protein